MEDLWSRSWVWEWLSVGSITEMDETDNTLAI